MPRLTYEGRPLDDDLVPIPTPVQIEAMLLESRRIAQEQARIKQGFRQPAHCRPLLSQPPVAGHDFARE